MQFSLYIYRENNERNYRPDWSIIWHNWSPKMFQFFGSVKTQQQGGRLSFLRYTTYIYVYCENLKKISLLKVVAWVENKLYKCSYKIIQINMIQHEIWPQEDRELYFLYIYGETS